MRKAALAMLTITALTMLRREKYGTTLCLKKGYHLTTNDNFNNSCQSDSSNFWYKYC